VVLGRFQTGGLSAPRVLDLPADGNRFVVVVMCSLLELQLRLLQALDALPFRLKHFVSRLRCGDELSTMEVLKLGPRRSRNDAALLKGLYQCVNLLQRKGQLILFSHIWWSSLIGCATLSGEPRSVVCALIVLCAASAQFLACL